MLFLFLFLLFEVLVRFLLSSSKDIVLASKRGNGFFEVFTFLAPLLLLVCHSLILFLVFFFWLVSWYRCVVAIGDVQLVVVVLLILGEKE